MENCEHMYVEMNPGDGLFFDCNVFHTSGPNTSNGRRWVIIPAYNQKRNDPKITHPAGANYTPLNMVTNNTERE